MKIAFVVSGFPTLSEKFILNQITGLLDMGHDIEIFAGCNPNERKMHPNVEKYHLTAQAHYFNVPRNKIKRIIKAIYLVIVNFYKSPIQILKSLNVFKYGKDALSLRLLYILIRFFDRKFDIIQCHFGPNGIIGVLLKEIGIKGKIITAFHGYDVNAYPKMAGKNIYNNLFRKGDLFTVNTNFTKQRVLELGCEENKITILPVGFQVEKFRFFERRVKHGEIIKILTVGRLVEKKGHEYAIQAVARIAKKYKNIQYMIAGDGPLRKTLEDLTSELKIRNHIRFLGAVEQDDVLRLYQQAHIFILPSVTANNGDQEGQALVLQEAQAVGVPVISTFHNGIPEGMLDGRSGFLVPERNIDTLAEKLRHLIEHPEIWPEMGRYGRKFVEEKYDIKNLNQRLVELYQKLIKGK